MKKELTSILGILMILNLVDAGVMGEAVADITFLLYGIAAGFAALLIAVHGIRWKTATSPSAREDAKKSIIMVIVALMMIIIAGTIVTMIYQIPSPQSQPSITARNWKSMLPDDQMNLELVIENTLGYALTGITVKVFTVSSGSCLQDDLSDSKSIPDINAGGSETYSHDNFCEDGNRFEISLECDQNLWKYCVECTDCPPALSGNCSVSTGSC